MIKKNRIYCIKMPDLETALVSVAFLCNDRAESKHLRRVENMMDAFKNRLRRIGLSTQTMRRVLAVLLCVGMVLSLFVDIAADAKGVKSASSVTEQIVSVAAATDSSLLSVPVAVEQSVVSEQSADLFSESLMLQDDLLQRTPVKSSNALGANGVEDPYYLYLFHPECGTVDNAYNPVTRKSTLTAQPYSGCKFYCWAEEYVDSKGENRIRLIQDAGVNPYYPIYQWTVNTTGRELYAYFIREGVYYTWNNNDCNEKGTIFFNGNSDPTGFYPETNLTISVVAKDGYKVAGIEYAYVSRLANEKEKEVEWKKLTSGDTATLTMPANDIWVRGIFYSTAKHTVTLTSVGNGKVTFKGTNNTQKEFQEGDIVEVTITPEIHHRLSEIRGLYSNFDFKTSSFKMEDIDTDLTFTFEYDENQYEILMEYSGYEAYTGEKLELIDKANFLVQYSCVIPDKYKKALVFGGWYEVVGDKEIFVTDEPVYAFRATRDIKLKARVTPGYQLVLSNAQTSNITVLPQKDCYLPGDTVKLIATPPSGNYLNKYTMAEYDVEAGAFGKYFDVEGDTITFGDKHLAVVADFKRYNIVEVEVDESNLQAGTVTGSGYYKPGETLTISAIPNEGYEFVMWKNKDSGNPASNESTFEHTFGDTVNGAIISLVAVFRALPKYTITAKSDSAYGSVTGGGEYVKGSTVTVIATPKENCYFEGWTENGKAVSTDATYLFTVDKDRTLTAVFKPVKVTVSASANNIAFGNVSGAGVYDKGAGVTLTATAKTGYRFVSWKEGGSVVSSDATYTFKATKDITLTADFVIDEDTIAVSANNDKYGSVSGGGTYQKGKSVILTATANNGYIFVNWTENGSVVSTDATYSFLMANARTLVANFKPKTFSVTVSGSPLEGGTVEKSGTCEYDTEVNVKATPAEGYRFLNWSEGGNPVSTNAEFSFTVSKDRALTAIFEKIVYYNIGVSPAPLNCGTVTGGGRYEAKTPVDVEAIPKAGFIFTNWTENGTVVSEKVKYTFTASANRTLVAHFDVDYREIKVSTADATLGSVSGGGRIQVGKTATVIATANQNCRFVNWTENGVPVSTDATFDFNVEKERNLVAVFEEIGKVTINAVSSDSKLGSVSGGGTHYVGSPVKLVATAFKNCRFVSWTENGEVVWSSVEYTFTAEQTRSLVANFETITHKITVEANDSTYGTVTGAGDYQQGVTVNLTATASEGYRFVKWTEDGKPVASSAEYSFECKTGRDLVAVFEAIPKFTVTVSSNDSTLGWVSGGGSVYEGKTVTVTATAKKYCLFDGWKMDGKIVSTAATYEFTPEKDCTILAEFSKDMVTVNVTSENAAIGSVSGGGEFQKGSPVTVIATAADDDHRFANWTVNGEVVIGSAKYEFQLLDNITLVAHFAKIEKRTVEAVSSNDKAGSVTGGGSYEVGATVNLIAKAGDEGIFENWTENGTVVWTESTYSFKVENDRKLVANFKEKTYLVQVQANYDSYGSVSGGGEFTKGQTATVTATPNEGYLFNHWIMNGKNVSAPSTYSFEVNGIVALAAVFIEDPNPVEYPLKVNGIRITNKNKDNITGTGISGSNLTTPVSYEGDSKKGTLTLNYATLICNRDCIVCEGGLELTIRLVGVNNIIINTSKENNLSGIYKEMRTLEPLTITGNGKLTIAGAKFGVWTDGPLTVNGSTIEISSDIKNSFGLNIGGDTRISENSNVTILADFIALYCFSSLFVSDGSKLNLTTTGEKSESKYCLHTGDDLVVNDGCKLTIKGHSGNGIDTDREAMILSSEMSVSALNCAIDAEDKITLGNGIAIATPAGGKISDKGTRIVDADGNVARELTLTKGITINATASSKEAGTVEGAGCYAPSAGTTVKLKAIPNEGYEFENWTEGNQVVSDKAAYEFSLQDERTLVANFRKKKFTIRFVDGDGTELQSEVLELGTNPVYNGKTPVKAATKQYTYTFAGWDNEVIAVAGDATYTAKYDSKLNSYQVVFDSNGGSEVAAKTVEYGSKLENVAEPVRKGFDFIGWFTDAACTKKADFTAPITDDCKFYAGWEEVFFIVTGDTSWDVKSGKDFHIHITRSRNDDILFGMFGGILLDGKPVDGKYYKAVKGSIDLTVSSELFKAIEDGNHEITVLIGDTSVTTKVAVSNDAGASEVVEAPKTGDTMPAVILLFLVLAALVMSGVVLYRRKNARA